MQVAHLFVLNNCDEIIEYLDEHEELMKREHPLHLYVLKHCDLFTRWFREQETNSSVYTYELYNMAIGTLSMELYSGCHVNDIKFLGAERDDKLCTQNSGVHVLGTGDIADNDFYGKLTIIIFKCCWFDTDPSRNGSVKQDDGLQSVNTTRCWYNEDPYILATMIKQIFYINDPKAGKGWKIVQRIDHKGVMNNCTIPYCAMNGITSSLQILYMSQLIRQLGLVSGSPLTPPPPTTTVVTNPPALALTSEAAMPESSTSSVTHSLLSARRSHRRSQPIDKVYESASASTAVGEGVEQAIHYFCHIPPRAPTTSRARLHRITILFALGPDYALTILFLGTHTRTFQWVTHPRNALAQTRLTSEFPLELFASSKFLEIDMFKEVYVRHGDEFTKGLHLSFYLRIMMDTIDQRLGPRLGKVYQGMGNAHHREMRVASLMEKVAELEQHMVVQHKHIATQSAHITTQEAHIASQESKMTQIIAVLQLTRLQSPPQPLQLLLPLRLPRPLTQHNRPQELTLMTFYCSFFFLIKHSYI
ncbi:hypothetical protein D8674_020498 [Pyrus ussuriensis x Pyrus communis]|uniref:DUF4216 domain-containing protein n=1 Tax=Pyrus ussuriensis x Pyrus communis TaxID=2448454 RepID=A0A5N5HMY3_9ROSA|nr:hypothetical protein D8674_020498 [Pyrus ussuriensis x Pyrus communis]